MDGVLYSTVAHNLYLNEGSFWNLQFITSSHQTFYGHPPLAMWIQSNYYSLFGSHWFVDKLYSLSTYIGIAFIIHCIWKNNLKQTAPSWLPILLWFIVPNVFWASGNNVLENTLTLFTLGATYFLLKNELKRNYLWVIIAGLLLFFGLFTKGFVALYPLSIPFFSFLLLRKTTFIEFLKTQFILILSVCIPVITLLYTNAKAYYFTQQYLNEQVIKSLERKITTVDSQFFILQRFAGEIILPLILVLLIVLFSRKMKQQVESQPQFKMILLFIAIGFSGILPVMISMKQSGFYILSTYPLFALGFALFISGRMDYLLEKLNDKKVFMQIFSVVVFTGGLCMAYIQLNNKGKDELLFADMQHIVTVVQQEKNISICPQMHESWTVRGYYKRYHSINLDFLENTNYYLIDSSVCTEVPENYQRVELPTQRYHLFKRVKN
jgi:4-amino-4-deoxy-L-arabinose transferase-like glycosyltransferase